VIGSKQEEKEGWFFKRKEAANNKNRGERDYGKN